MKPSIDQQIEAVNRAYCHLLGSGSISGGDCRGIEAALTTLEWLKANPEVAKLVYRITKEFPGATVNPREEE